MPSEGCHSCRRSPRNPLHCYNPRGRRSSETDCRVGEGMRQLRQGVSKNLHGEWCADARFVSGAPNALHRNCELRNALECGDAALIAKFGSLLSQGSVLLATSSGDDLMDGKSRSADRRSRHQTQTFGGVCHVGAVTSREPSLRNVRYGLWGIRSGRGEPPRSFPA